jgi:small GTP-binding protein
MLTSFARNKERILGALTTLGSLAGAIGMRSLQADITGKRLPKLAEERFHLVVLGEFNHGKTTFVNALLGQELLPVGITPTTAALNHVVWAEQPWAAALLQDGRRVAIEPKDLAQWLTVEGAHTAQAHVVEVGFPAEILRDRVTLVDTPGVNDINEQRAEITFGYIPRADAVIFLLDATQVLKASERSFLTQRILKRSRDKLLFVLNKIDLLDAEEARTCLAYAHEHVGALVGETEIFPLSAKLAARGETAASGFPPFLAHLRRFLVTDRGRVLLDNSVNDGLRTAAYLQQNLGIKRRSLALQLDELEERIGRVRLRLEGTLATVRSQQERIRAETQAIKAKARLDLEAFVEAFAASLPPQIEKASADEVQRYLEDYIKDTFKAWAEEEGEHIAGLLETLAEEIIQITNENVGELMETLAAQLGQQKASIPIDVDLFKYDLATVALGAFGTTIFLFVNMVVGGILTVAAPLLAVLMRERALGKIKEQAKVQAPQVIRAGGQALGPRFEEAIDGFGERLTDFVTQAGETLERGISEILDQALQERRQSAEDRAARERDLDTHEAQLTAVERELEVVRAELWAASAEGPEPAPAAGAGTPPAGPVGPS